MHIYTQAMSFTGSFWESEMDPVRMHMWNITCFERCIYIYMPINSINPEIGILRPSEGTLLLPIGF